MEPVTLVDAENVRRSEWPNIGRAELVELVRGWARTVGVQAILVFDGPAPAAEEDEHLRLVGTRRESADDAIARRAAELVRDASPYRLVTSDRGLRSRAGACADDLVGGGTFARMLRAARAAETASTGGGSPSPTSGPSAPSSRVVPGRRA